MSIKQVFNSYLTNQFDMSFTFLTGTKNLIGVRHCAEHPYRPNYIFPAHWELNLVLKIRYTHVVCWTAL